MKLNPLFSDGVVLQRGKPICIWGYTAPNNIVKITLNGKDFYGASAADGYFRIRLAAMEAGGPYVMTVCNEANGDSVSINDVMIGEVWIASGQSNMQFAMRSSETQMLEFENEKNPADQLRMFTVRFKYSGTFESEAEGKWRKTNETLPEFSAVALWFARTIQRKLGIAVGIIHSSLGGTIVEAWTSRSTLVQDPTYAETLSRYGEVLTASANWDEISKDHVLNSSGDNGLKIIQDFKRDKCPKDLENKGFASGWAGCDFDDSAWSDFPVPGKWTDGFMEGCGIVWFRKTVDIPSEHAGKDLLLEFGGIDKQDTTYFNGVQVGKTGSGLEDRFWAIPRKYTVPGSLVKAGRNVIAVRVYSFVFDGGFNGLKKWYRLSTADGLYSMSLFGTWKAFAEARFGQIAYPNIPWTFLPENPKQGNPNSPSILFDSMIRPLLPYSIRGVIWYQGESNADGPGTAYYGNRFANMIRDWRFHFEQGNFPFIFVQLANYLSEPDHCWPEIRDFQRRTLDAVENTGMAVTIDIGERVNIHPLDKRSVGERLAAWALKHTYHIAGITASGPLYERKETEGSRLRVFFRECESGLEFRGEGSSGFEISDTGKEYVPADAVIEGNSVVLSAASVKYPHYVRYAWKNDPECCLLFNKAGLPAATFGD